MSQEQWPFYAMIHKHFEKCLSWKYSATGCLYNAPINVKPAAGWGGGGRRGIGEDFDGYLWPKGRAFGLSCCPGVGKFEFLFVPVTTNHFTGWGIPVIFDVTFLLRGREFYSNFLENVKIPPRGELRGIYGYTNFIRSCIRRVCLIE